MHLALAWDETSGIRFYVNGKLAAEKAATGLFDTALDQFGPHSRIIAPNGVESSYNYDRGGDIDELRIYDRMLSDDNIASLARGRDAAIHSADPIPLTDGLAAGVVVPLRLEPPRRHSCSASRAHTTVRKVEIHDVYDLKRWWWKGTDGIRETTWPGVFNRSRLLGRYDYFQLPDWDCYSLSGKSSPSTCPTSPGIIWRSRAARGATCRCLRRAEGQPGAVPTPISTILRPCSQDSLRAAQGTGAHHAPVRPAHHRQKVRFTNVEQE